METRRYAMCGAVLGMLLPLTGTVIEAASRPELGLTPGGMAAAVASSKVLWITFTAPFFLGALASLAGRHQDHVAAVEAARREGYLATASELFGAAQALLTTVSSFSSTTAATAASVRATTATMEQLGQTATRAALTAETVIGLARQGERCSVEGLSAVDASTAEMARLADEVRVLSERIEGLNGRMRDVFGIASVVDDLADRAQRLAEHADWAAEGTGAAAKGFVEVVAELRRHADGARRASAQVKGMLQDVHEAMLEATRAAEIGIGRAEQGAQVAAGTGDTIRRLAGALRDSSQAAQEIAAVAQQQDHGIDQVLKAMNEIYLATQETMSSTQSVATEAEALNELASGLKRAVEA